MEEGYLIPVGMEISRLTQMYRHNLYNGDVGDCYRTALACLLGKSSPDEVPHFVRESIFANGDSGWVYQRMREWLRREEDVDLAFIDVESLADMDVHYMFTVASKYGPWNHVVVAKGNEVVWDPAGWKAADPYTLDDGVNECAEVLCLPYFPYPFIQRRLWRAGVAPKVYTPKEK